MSIWKICAALVLCVVTPLPAQPFRAMDYGPFLTMSVEVAPGDIAQKALCIRVDQGGGGVAAGKAFVAFDTDTLRYAAAWSGDGFIDWRGIVFDGAHNAHPKIVGRRTFANPTAPGWGHPDTLVFDDTRIRGLDKKPYGPLRREWAHWKGLHQLANRVVLEYTLGGTTVFELPGLLNDRDDVFTRTIQMSPHSGTHLIQVAHERGGKPSLTAVAFQKPDGAPAMSKDLVIVPIKEVAIPTQDQLTLGRTDYTISAWIKTPAETGTIFSKAAPDGEWVPKGKTFFVRGGRLGFDVGWVGAVNGRTRVADGKWHHVAMTHRGSDGRVTLFVDGEEDAHGDLPSHDVPGHVVRLGYTATTFMSAFKGAMDDVHVFRRVLGTADLVVLARGDAVTKPEARWTFDDTSRNIAPSSVDDGYIAHLDGARIGRGKTGRGLVFDGRGQVRIGDRFKAERKPPPHDTENQTVLAIALAGASDAAWAFEGGNVRLRLDPSASGRRFTLAHWRGKRRDLPTLARALSMVTNDVDIEDFSKVSMPTRRPETVFTTAKRVHDTGPFAVDELTLPNDNPWKSWIRLGGFDFFDDGDRAAVASWQGDVWVVSGLSKLDSGDPKLSWRCIASGLFQPLGLKIKNGDVYVLGRDQITRLVDRNGDGETDFYENFNNDAQVTEHFHEFAMDLQTDAAGNFYYMKGARHAKTAVVPHHGTLIKVSADGRQSEVLASGFRAPNGLSVNDDGTFFTSDQEGHWTPMNRINHVVRGGFYGNMMGYCPKRKDTSHDPPLCWIHKNTDRSPAAQVVANTKRWSPLNGALLSLSYGTGRIWNVLHERVNGVTQGGIVQLPMPEFPTGIQRGRFRKQDGQLYICGLFGWSSNKTRSGGFFRVSRTSEPLDIPTSLNIVENGVIIGFNEPLDPATATDPRRYRIQRWNYKRTRNYGSQDWKVSDGKPGRDTVVATGAKLSRDGRAIFLQLPEMGPCMQMEIQYQLRAARGSDLGGKIHHTIHALGTGTDLADRFEGGLRVAASARSSATDHDRGLEFVVRSRLPGRTDEVNRSVTRLAAIHVEPGTVASPYVTRGPFHATWIGFLDVDAPGRYRFHADTTTDVKVSVGGVEVFGGGGHGRNSRRIDGDAVELLAGPTPIRIDLTSDDRGGASLRLLWSGRGFRIEPVPPMVLRHASHGDLIADLRIDTGRTLFGERGCVRCHDLPGGHHLIHRTTMPELSQEAPALDAAGSRFEPTWMFEWMLEPHRLQRHPSMPDLFPTNDEDARRDAADITAWLTSQTARPRAVVADPPGASADAGRILYEDLGCIACHTFEAPEKQDGHDRHSLRFTAAKYRAGALRAYLESPRAHHAWSRMPDYGLEKREAASLALFIRSRSQGRVRAAGDLTAGDSRRGKDAFASRGCIACHRVDSSPLARPEHAPSFELGKEWTSGCVAERPPPRACDFRLSKDDRDAIRAFIAREDGTALQQIAAHATADRAMTSANCTACHDRDGVPSSRLDILVLEGRDNAHLEPLPALTWTGEKLQPAWTEALLRGRLDYRARPWMRGRMPAFPARGQYIARGLPSGHGVPRVERSRSKPDAALAKVGEQLAQGEGAFNCHQCHSIGPLQAFGPFGDRGVNFTRVGERLRHDFYTRWMHAPQRVDPGTKMPGFTPDGRKTAVASILGGDADAQFAALWHYLVSKPQSSRAFVRKWTIADLAPKLTDLESGRDFETGRKLFRTMSCGQCHKIAGQGGSIGPDLSKISEKHTPLTLLQELLIPSKVIDAQYQIHVIFTKEDEIIDGMLLSEDARTLRILTNPLDPKSAVTVRKSDIDERRTSDASPMPTDLLDTVAESEILDLLAYLRAGGDRSRF